MGKTQKIDKFAGFKRGWNGLVVICFFIIVVGGMISGVSPFAISVRALILIVILFFAGRILITTWSSWEEIRHGGAQASLKRGKSKRALKKG